MATTGPRSGECGGADELAVYAVRLAKGQVSTVAGTLLTGACIVYYWFKHWDLFTATPTFLAFNTVLCGAYLAFCVWTILMKRKLSRLLQRRMPPNC